MTTSSNMYANARTWNPFKGCKFDCLYCLPSFQRQAKRQKHHCMKCYNYIPHCHPDRLSKIPASKIVFVCGNADIAFCSPAFVKRIIDAIKNRKGRSAQTYYLQSKKPSCLEPFLKLLNKDFILLTTLETNRDKGYRKISRAPLPTKRYQQFLSLKYPRKAVTIEPIMDFDVNTLASWMIKIKPEYVWLGYDSKNCHLPEPSKEKLLEFVKILNKHKIAVLGKTLRGIKLPKVVKTQG